MSRKLIVVDLETTALHNGALPLEVCAINVENGAEIYFVPFIKPDQLAKADPEALQINRYYERGVFKLMLDEDATQRRWYQLRQWLDGNTLAGSNPRYDAGIIERRIDKAVWHHRLADLAAYAAGKLDIDPTELEGLAGVCERLGVTNEEPHGAKGDARAAATCFGILRDIPAAQLLRDPAATARNEAAVAL